MSDDQKNFLGIPIHGDITAADSRVKQKPDAELQEAIRTLLEFESFTKLKWRQYTPYFNDGDPCVFSAYGVGILVPGGEEFSVGDYEDGYYDLPRTYVSEYMGEEANKLLDEFVGRYTIKHGYVDGKYVRTESKWELEPADRAMIDQATEVAGMIESGAYDDFLMRTFGDHAVVTLSAQEIDVEFYRHD